MGRYSYPCQKCGQQITEKVGVSNTDPIAHKLCAVCEEEARKKLLAEVNAEADDLQS